MTTTTARRWAALTHLAAVVALVVGVRSSHWGNAVSGFLILAFCAAVIVEGTKEKR